MPQNSWPTVAITTTALAAEDVSALLKIENTSPPPWLTALTSVAANVIASSTIQPPTPDQKTERHTPLAADSAAPLVSSEMWAEASYPVCVYIVSRKPSGST